MDQRIKITLYVIAVSLIILNVQIAIVSVVSEARGGRRWPLTPSQKVLRNASFYNVENGLKKIATAIQDHGDAVRYHKDGVHRFTSRGRR